MKTERYQEGELVLVGSTPAVVLQDDGGPLIRVQYDNFVNGVLRGAVRDSFARGLVRKAAPAEMLDARELATIARPLAGIPIIDHRADGARLPIPTEPDPIVKVWTRLDPRTRRRIERASRALVVALDRHVEKELEK